MTHWDQLNLPCSLIFFVRPRMRNSYHIWLASHNKHPRGKIPIFMSSVEKDALFACLTLLLVYIPISVYLAFLLEHAPMITRPRMNISTCKGTVISISSCCLLVINDFCFHWEQSSWLLFYFLGREDRTTLKAVVTHLFSECSRKEKARGERYTQRGRKRKRKRQ